MIYLPEDSVYKYCPHFATATQGNITFRVYDSMPQLGQVTQTLNYKDIYINQHYFTNTGTVTLTRFNYTCLTDSEITHDIYYRQDFDSICLIFLTLFFFVFVMPFILFRRFFRRLK